MKQKEIRENFFKYFETNKHYKVLSSPLIPAQDNTLLFNNAGMNQFKKVFLQEEERSYKIAVSIQKCMRVSGKHNDFDEVGKTEYHHTFFEMMGNFSFGDYFKKEAITYAWEVLTKIFNFNPKDLWITVHNSDDEAFNIWKDEIGIPSQKIVRLGDKDNFWQMGNTGPCGPCSEIHFDKGEIYGTDDIENNSKRFVEIWNLVFMQFYKDIKGKLESLPAPSIDTGMGIERLSALLQDCESNYDSDLFLPIIEETANMCSKDYKEKENSVSFKVIADHIRALTFLIADGIIPSNEGRGYVLKRVLRRASKHGKNLGFEEPFLFELSNCVIKNMTPFYPQLKQNQKLIEEIIKVEEIKFNRTLIRGLKIFDNLVLQNQKKNQNTISGEELFKLSDTYGFPLDFAQDLATEKNMAVDIKGFEKQLEQQKELSRDNDKVKKNKDVKLEGIEKLKNEFLGYKQLEAQGKIIAIYKDNKRIDKGETGEKLLIIFDQTPFYGEGGGQVGDIGIIRGENGEEAVINSCGKNSQGIILHNAEIIHGDFKVNKTYTLQVNKQFRQETAIHHTATHMLHSALRETLGLHVKQAGSHVNNKRLRFDFTHYKNVEDDELKEIENNVNSIIRKGINVTTDNLSYEEALSKGALAFFDEKYSDKVRMVSIGDVSKELCGGTHIKNSMEAGIFRIVSESSISSGIRRIEAIAGESAYLSIAESLNRLRELTKLYKNKEKNLIENTKTLMENLKKKEKELKQKTVPKKEKINSQDIAINGYKLTLAQVMGDDSKQINTIADNLKAKNKSIAIVFHNNKDKSRVIVALDKNLESANISACDIIKNICSKINGKGGGKKNFAQGGGERIKDLNSFSELVKETFENM